MSQPSELSTNNWNVPNVLSAIRLGMALMVPIALPFKFYWVGFILFVVAASTDWIDGWWARKFKQVTQLGRILDPFADKMIICGTLICLAVATKEFPWYASIHGWIVVAIVGRELLVTALRSFIEQAGGDFSAKFAAKLKMVFQCIAAGAALLALTYDDPTLKSIPIWITVGLTASLWLALIFTLYSGFEYIVAAAKFTKKMSAETVENSEPETAIDDSLEETKE